jgi:glycosyltransferase involved in cell wall biosynthesis
MPDSLLNKLSVCMIVKNEAAILGRCLESVRSVADEIIVVDTGSADSTVEIARGYHAIVVPEAWRNDFSHARNVSLAHATCGWILWLDADDVVPEESVAALNNLKSGKPDTVFAFIVRNEKPGNIGSEFLQARMFPNNRGVRFERRIHEQMMPSALKAGLKLVSKPIVIEHHGYGEPEELRRKALRNVKLLTDDYDKSRPDAVTAVEIADSYSILDKQADAALWYEHVISINGCEKNMPVIASQAHLGLGNVYNKKESYDTAISHFISALHLCPDRPDALYCLAVAYDLSGRRQEAVETLARIIDAGKRSPLQVSIDFRQTSIKAYIRIAAILGTEQRFDELSAVVEKALSQYGDRPEIQNMAGTALYHQGRLIEAMRAFEKSIGITAAGNIDAYIGLCVIYRKAGRPETADSTLENIRPLFADSPRYRAFTGIIRHEAEDVEPGERKKIEKERGYLRRLYRLS